MSINPLTKPVPEKLLKKLIKLYFVGTPRGFFDANITKDQPDQQQTSVPRTPRITSADIPKSRRE